MAMTTIKLRDEHEALIYAIQALESIRAVDGLPWRVGSLAFVTTETIRRSLPELWREG